MIFLDRILVRFLSHDFGDRLWASLEADRKEAQYQAYAKALSFCAAHLDSESTTDDQVVVLLDLKDKILACMNDC